VIELAIEQKENALTGTWIVKIFMPHGKTYSFSGDSNNRGAIISIHEGERTILSSSVVEKGYAYLSPNGEELFTLTMKDTTHRLLFFRSLSYSLPFPSLPEHRSNNPPLGGFLPTKNELGLIILIKKGEIPKPIPSLPRKKAGVAPP